MSYDAMTLAEHHVQVDTENLTAVVDTNVLLDVFSCHDLVNEYQKLGAARAATDPTAVYRRARARESLLLTMYFHSLRAFTYSLREGFRLMLAKVDPDAHASLETHYTKVFVHFVREQLLDQWTACMPTDDGNDPKGNEADDALVAYAQLHRLPLISNEAFSPRGVVTDKIRKKAAAAGVQVFTPKEFYRGRIDEAENISSFIRRFRERSPAYVREHHEPEIISDTIGTLDGYYRHILLGETARRAAWRTPSRFPCPEQRTACPFQCQGELCAYVAHREQPCQRIVITRIGHRDRSEATLAVGRSGGGLGLALSA